MPPVLLVLRRLIGFWQRRSLPQMNYEGILANSPLCALGCDPGAPVLSTGGWLPRIAAFDPDDPQHVLSLQSPLRGGCTQTRHESQCHVISSCHWNLHFAACLYRSRAMYMVLSPINWLRGIKQGLCIVPKKCSFLSPNLRWIYLFVSPVHPSCGTSPRRSRHSCCTAEVSSRGRTFVNGVANVSAMVKKDPVRDVELTKT